MSSTSHCDRSQQCLNSTNIYNNYYLKNSNFFDAEKFSSICLSINSHYEIYKIGIIDGNSDNWAINVDVMEIHTIILLNFN